MSNPFSSRMFVIFYSIWSRFSVLSLKYNSLNGQHIRVIWSRWSGNPKGLAGPAKSGLILDYLKDRLNFIYEMVRVTENILEPQGKQSGLFNYLLEDKCDFLMAGVAPTFGRMKLADLTLPWMYDCNDLLFAVQDDMVNIDAVVKPFQWPVWLGMLISMIVVITILNTFKYRLLPKIDSASVCERKNHTIDTNESERHPPRVKKGDGKQFLYVFGNLLSQGGPCTSKRLSFRLVAGVWTLAAFIFVQAYTSILFTYVVAPVNHPLIDSMHGAAESTNINLLIRYGSTMDVIVMDSNMTAGVFVKLQKKIFSSPDSRCNLISQCLSLITPGSRNAYAGAKSYHLEAIKNNFEQTGKCGLQLAGDNFLSSPVNFALQKHSPYTNTINKGLLDLLQTGMIDHWESWVRPIPLKCMANVKKGYKKSETKQRPISLKNLTGAFVVLLVGFSISFLAFLVEQIISMSDNHFNGVKTSPEISNQPTDSIVDSVCDEAERTSA